MLSNGGQNVDNKKKRLEAIANNPDCPGTDRMIPQSNMELDNSVFQFHFSRVVRAHVGPALTKKEIEEKKVQRKEYARKSRENRARKEKEEKEKKRKKNEENKKMALKNIKNVKK